MKWEILARFLYRREAWLQAWYTDVGGSLEREPPSALPKEVVLLKGKPGSLGRTVSSPIGTTFFCSETINAHEGENICLMLSWIFLSLNFGQKCAHVERNGQKKKKNLVKDLVASPDLVFTFHIPSPVIRISQFNTENCLLSLASDRLFLFSKLL